ncbi:MAG: peptidylprolyl isomerase [Acidimicrobiales bacterium]
MKRIPKGLVAVVSIVAMGAVASACNVTPNAASVNGDTVSVSTLNTEMNDLQNSPAGECVLALEDVQSGVGSGVYSMTFAGYVLSTLVSYKVSAQYAAVNDIHLSRSDLAEAQNVFTASLSGEISSTVQQASASGGISHCQEADGSAFTGPELLAAMPAALRNSELGNQAVDDELLTRGADLSNAAVLSYYAANQSQFTFDCVSVIATDTEAQANTIVAKLQAGASFSQLATADSVDAQTASSGGQVGCDIPESQVLQSLQLTSVTVGQPVTPIQTSQGNWVIYEITSRTVQPVTSSATVIRQELLHTTANVQRVSDQLVAFAHHSSITVNPQYGTWTGIKISAPPSPATRFLQPSYLASSAASGGASTGTASSAGDAAG